MMTILFEKKFAALDGVAVRDFAALCAAGRSYFGEALVGLAEKLSPSTTVSPTLVAVLATRAWATALPRQIESGGDDPEGFRINEVSVSHADVYLTWGVHEVTLRILADSEEVSRHAWAAWQEALGLPQNRRNPLEGPAKMATATVAGRDWSARWCALKEWPFGADAPAGDLDSFQAQTRQDWEDWAQADMAWRPRIAGLLEGSSPPKPEVPAEAVAWAKAYAEAVAATEPQRRGPAKRVVVRRKPDEIPPTSSPWTS